MVVKRWTDEMLDELASSVSVLHEDVGELRVSVTELRQDVSELRQDVSELRKGISVLHGDVSELRESVSDVKDSVDGLRITVQALLQVAAQGQRDMELMKQRQAETDQRFNILLEEFRFLNRGNNGS